MITAGAIGIMQGRLVPPETESIQSFPLQRWRDEFEFASQLGIEAIEWIYDSRSADLNPLLTPEGIHEIQGCVRRTGVGVKSVCADFFMEYPLIGAQAADVASRARTAARLMANAREVGVRRMVLPFVDQSAIRGQGDLAGAVSAIGLLLPAAEQYGVELHLETDLPPAGFAVLLTRLDHPMIKVNYDSGNSASLGYVVKEEFAAYGGRVGSVHIKDRVMGGGTVPLGNGDADFDALFKELANADYRGDVVLQVARGRPGDERAWVRGHLEFLSRHLTRKVNR